VRRYVCFALVFTFILICVPGKSYANDSKLELEWDYLTHWHFNGRYIDTASLHILENVSRTDNKSVYRGITITRPHGHIINDQQQTKDSSAVGVGPVYMIRNERMLSGKLYEALEASGGLILYDKAFPAGGRAYNFMWRIGPQFIYKINENSSVNVGYMFMHVSNGFKTHNPGYNAHGASLSFVMKY